MSGEVEFSADEASLLVAFTSTLDPAKFVKDEAKALIYKCKGAMAQAKTDGSVKLRFRGNAAWW